MLNLCQNPSDECPHSRRSAELAVKRVFAILGVDIDVPHEVEQFRENLRFGASMRRAADKGAMAIVGIIVAGMMAALWSGVVSKITGGH